MKLLTLLAGLTIRKRFILFLKLDFFELWQETKTGFFHPCFPSRLIKDAWIGLRPIKQPIKIISRSSSQKNPSPKLA